MATNIFATKLPVHVPVKNAFNVNLPSTQSAGAGPGGISLKPAVSSFAFKPAVPHPDIVPNQRKTTTDAKTGLSYDIGTDSGGTTLAWFNGSVYGNPTTLPMNAGLRQALDKAAAVRPVSVLPPPPSLPSTGITSVVPKINPTLLVSDSKGSASAPSSSNTLPMSAPSAADTVIPGPAQADAVAVGGGIPTPLLVLGVLGIGYFLYSRSRGRS